MLSAFCPNARRWFPISVLAALAILGGVGRSCLAAAAADAAPALTVVVMDPLALPLSCPCVQGYAQRKYEKLGEYLEARLHRSVKLVFNESLSAALREQTDGRADLIIGKCSVVRFDGAKNKMEVTPLLMLSGKDGSTTQTGLIVVPSADPAKSPKDLQGYRIVFGPKECDEKHAAALALLKENGVVPTGELETSPACSDGACSIIEAGPDVRGAAVISSYAKPLLEGCGTVEKGALRVVGETAAVPFIGAFTTGSVSSADAAAIRNALSKAGEDPALMLALESKNGFVPMRAEETTAAKKK